MRYVLNGCPLGIPQDGKRESGGVRGYDPGKPTGCGLCHQNMSCGGYPAARIEKICRYSRQDRFGLKRQPVLMEIVR